MARATGELPEIAFFIRALEGGGASRDSIVLANAVAETGIRTAILTLKPDGPLRSLVAPAVRLVGLGATKLRSAIPALAWTLASLRPSVLVSAEAAANLVALSASRLLPKSRRPKIVLREVSSPTPALSLPVYRSNYLGYRLAGFVYSRADLALTLTQGARTDLIENFGVPAERIAVMRNAALPSDIAGRLKGTDAAPREPGLIVSVGRLSPEKDQITLVKAMALLPPEREARLALAGDGPLQQELIDLIAVLGLQNRVTLLGQVNDPLPLLERAQLAVCSSRYEGFGNAIVEALACGTPVVSTDCPFGPREILEDGKYGRLVPVGDPGAMAAAMSEALASPVDRAALRARAWCFTADKAASDLLRSLRS